MATLQERFDKVEADNQITRDKMTEASTEIIEEIRKLKEGGGLTEEQEAGLQRIETSAKGLAEQASGMADISPPV